MRLSEIGEFGLIRLLAREFGIEYPPAPGARSAGLLVGLGDDALVTEPDGAAIIWTTDAMVAGEHFLPERTAWPDVGWKALASNVSDVAAMGGRPKLALVTLMLPPDTCVDDVVALYRGMRECATAFGVTLGGGDIVRSPVFAITTALSGRAYTGPDGRPAVLRRAAAQPGDLVAVTGTPGDSAGGLKLLLAGKPAETEAERRLIAAHERPTPRVDLGEAAVRCGLRCGMDVSDGLMQDLGHIATASRAGIVVDASKLPLSDELRAVWPNEAQGLALGGGEDYELVVAGPSKVIAEYVAVSDGAVTVIGEVVASETPSLRVLDAAGKDLAVGRGGWDHFTTA